MEAFQASSKLDGPPVRRSPASHLHPRLLPSHLHERLQALAHTSLSLSLYPSPLLHSGLSVYPKAECNDADSEFLLHEVDARLMKMVRRPEFISSYPVVRNQVPKIIKKGNSAFFAGAQSLQFSNSSTEKVQFHSSISSETLASSLHDCRDIYLLKKLHACVFTCGFECNSFLGSKLLNAYAHFGLLTESRWVFNKIVNCNLSLWNSFLVGYFQAGKFDEVLRVYCDLRRRKIRILGSAITYGLKSCAQLGSLEIGRTFHVDAFKFGFDADPFVGSSLIGFYSKYGDIEDAFRVFDKITERDIVAYTSMITGYAQAGDNSSYGAFRVASLMQNDELEPNRVTLVSLLQAAAYSKALDYGKSIHGYAIRRGIGCLDEVFETSLLDMYVKCGSPRKATAVYEKMSSRTIGCSNVLIAGYLHLGQPLEALVLFCLMVLECHEFDLITLANVILSCADLELLKEGKSIHAYILRTGIQPDVVASTALIDMYLNCKNTGMAREIFDRIEEKDVILFNVMMAGYLQNGFTCEAIGLFREMVKSGNRHNQSTVLSILGAFSNLKDIRGGMCIHGYVLKHNLLLKTDIANQLIYVYAKCGSVDSARQVFGQIKHKDLVSWTSMMAGYVNLGHANEAIALYRFMQRENFNPDSVMLTCLLQAFSNLGSASIAKEIHCRVLRASMEKDITIMNSLLTTYSKCGKLEAARNLFQHVDGRCLTSWNSMIAAYGMHGKCVEALKLFDQMKREKVAPDEVTFASVLSSCSHAGMVEEGLCVFKSMKKYSLMPSEVHYGCVVDLLSRAGQLEEAYDLLKCFPPIEIASAVGALVAACRVHGNTEMGEAIGKRLLDLEPENASTYGLVSNLYAEGEKWNEVAQIRADAKERGLKRATGYSIVEVDKRVSQT